MANQTLVPPEEAFWQRYSPHFELPLAGASSLLLHGLVLGAIVVLTATYFFQGGEQNVSPPSMDVVMLSGGGGDGEEGAGAEPGAPGEPGQEQVAELTPATPNDRPGPELPPDLKEAAPIELDVPDAAAATDTSADLFKEIREEAKKQAERKEPKTPTTPRKLSGTGKRVAKSGTGNPKGAGGLGGSGGGLGRGTKGRGTGSGGGPGRAATRAEVLAWRWRFNLQGSPREHADKLAAIGVTLAVPKPGGGGFLIARDLKRRPVDVRFDSLAAYKDAVKWYNTDAQSVRGLANELQLPFVPPHVILLLPKDREQKMAAEEERFARERRHNLAKVRATWFDFRLRGGGYEPVAIRQE